VRVITVATVVPIESDADFPVQGDARVVEFGMGAEKIDRRVGSGVIRWGGNFRQ
jgi:hypothetical protein